MARTAILTGAASGLGLAMAVGLLGAGINVAAVDKDEAALRELAGVAAERRLPGALQTITADLSQEASFATIVDAALARFGGIDALVNNAGIGQSSVRADQRRT